MKFPGKKEARKIKGKNVEIAECYYHGGTYTRQMIEKEVARLQARYPNKVFRVSLLYEKPMSGNAFGSQDPISLFTLTDHYDESQMPDPENRPLDPETYERFWVYIHNPISLSGGCSPKQDNSLNDCLYNCLKKAYGTKWRLPPVIKTPELLKTRLRLQRSDPIPVSLIGEVEMASSIAINISGDHYYKSTRNSKRKIDLVLANGHYSLARDPNRQKAKWFSKPAIPIAYMEDYMNYTVELYDGKSFSTIPLVKFKKQIYSSPKYCYIEVRKKKDKTFETLTEAYTRFNEERNALLEKSKKFGIPMDISMCGGNEKVMALWAFERCSLSVPANEPLDPQEAKWISDTMRGGLIWAKNEWKGHGRQYDFTSMYPYLLQKYFFPIKKGKFDVIPDYIYNNRGNMISYYGIFHAEVELQEDMRSVFSYSKINKYTHHDLNNARALGLKYTLIQDGTPNALIYDSKAIYPGAVMFGAIVEFLFKIKSEGGPAGQIAKRIINIIWGALSQRSYKHELEDDSFEIPEGAIIESLHSVEYRRVSFKLSYPDKLFRGEYPRIAPFLTALARKKVSEEIQPHKDKVRRIHTDGFVLEEDSESLPLINCPEDASMTLGALKFEKEGNCYVKNANQVVWS